MALSSAGFLWLPEPLSVASASGGWALFNVDDPERTRIVRLRSTVRGEWQRERLTTLPSVDPLERDVEHSP